MLDVEDPWVRETQYLVKFDGGVEGGVPSPTPSRRSAVGKIGQVRLRTTTGTAGSLPRVRDGIVDRSAELTADI